MRSTKLVACATLPVASVASVASVALATLVALVACGGPRKHTSTGEGSSAIQGGTEDEVHTFAVAVIMPESTCSGTLIAPNLVLTARHCVADSGNSDEVDCARDRFSAPAPASRFSVTTAKVVRGSTARYRVAKIVVPSESKFCGNDIALLQLTDNVPASEATPATPALDPPMTSHPLYGTTVATLGYGISGPKKTDDGTRRLREDVPIQCTPGDPEKSCRLSDFDITPTEFVAGDGLCSGDSGGSAFDQESFTRGRPVTFGVLSRASETGFKCIDAVFTRTDAFAGLLVAAATEAAEQGGYPLPVWAGGAGSADAGAEGGPAAPPTVEAASPPGAACATGSAGRGPSGAAPATLVAVLACVAAARRRRR